MHLLRCIVPFMSSWSEHKNDNIWTQHVRAFCFYSLVSNIMQAHIADELSVLHVYRKRSVHYSSSPGWFLIIHAFPPAHWWFLNHLTPRNWTVVEKFPWCVDIPKITGHKATGIFLGQIIASIKQFDLFWSSQFLQRRNDRTTAAQTWLVLRK